MRHWMILADAYWELIVFVRMTSSSTMPTTGCPTFWARARVGFTVSCIPLSVLLSPQGLRCVWSRQAAPSPEVTTTHVRDALGNLNSGKVSISAQLPSAEMTIADLASMKVGDVIHLSTRADEHIALQVGDSPHTLLANLGLACGSRALQIVGVASQEKNKQITSN